MNNKFLKQMEDKLNKEIEEVNSNIKALTKRYNHIAQFDVLSTEQINQLLQSAENRYNTLRKDENQTDNYYTNKITDLQMDREPSVGWPFLVITSIPFTACGIAQLTFMQDYASAFSIPFALAFPVVLGTYITYCSALPTQIIYAIKLSHKSNKSEKALKQLLDLQKEATARKDGTTQTQQIKNEINRLNTKKQSLLTELKRITAKKAPLNLEETKDM